MFYGFGFYNSSDRHESLIQYMKATYERNSSKRQEKPKNYKIDTTYAKEYKLRAGIPLKPKEKEDKKALEFISSRKSSLMYTQTYGWGQIAKVKPPYVVVNFPKDRPNKLFTKEEPMSTRKFKEYLNKVGAEDKKFDFHTLLVKRGDFNNQ